MKTQNRAEGVPVSNSKEPEIYYKDPPPQRTNRDQQRNQGQAALRRRSSPNKGEAEDYHYNNAYHRGY